MTWIISLAVGIGATTIGFILPGCLNRWLILTGGINIGLVVAHFLL